MGIAKSAAGQLPANSAIKRSSREVGKWAKSTIADLYIPRKFTKLDCFHHTKKHPMPIMYSSTLSKFGNGFPDLWFICCVPYIMWKYSKLSYKKNLIFKYVHLNTTQCTAVLRFFNTVFFFLYIADKRPILLFQIRNLPFLHSNENLIKSFQKMVSPKLEG